MASHKKQQLLIPSSNPNRTKLWVPSAGSWKFAERLTSQRKRVTIGQFVTRFSREWEGKGEMDKQRHNVLGRRKYSAHEILQVRRLAMELGEKEAAKRTGIPQPTVHVWMQYDHLPAAGPYCFANMLDMVRRAKHIFDRHREDELSRKTWHPKRCLMTVAKEMGLDWGMCDNWFKWEAVPAIPGFPMYADPAVQLRCEEYARRGWGTGSPMQDIPRMRKPRVVKPKFAGVATAKKTRTGFALPV